MDSYDVVIVGARVAGAATARLLAQAGYRILVLDRSARGSDTLSTHALMRPAVLQLERWGLLAEVVDAGTPAVDCIVFHYGDRALPVEAKRPLYAPRRTVLDPILVAAAEQAGADVRFGVDVMDLLRDDTGRVTGVRARDRRSGTFGVRARVTIGADGRRSRVARAVNAELTHRGAAHTAFLYGHWAGVGACGYEWGFRPAPSTDAGRTGTTSGLIPTNDGRVCVFVGMSPHRFATEVRKDLLSGLRRVLAETSPSMAVRVAGGSLSGPLRGDPGMPGWLRRPWGPGWALVGDAGYYKDPTNAHGITDALRDAELLAVAVHDTLSGTAPYSVAMSRYERIRDELSLPMFAVTEAVAGLRWTLPEVQQHHLDMSAVMQQEVDVLSTMVAPAPTVAA